MPQVREIKSERLFFDRQNMAFCNYKGRYIAATAFILYK